MHNFQELLDLFENNFSKHQFPSNPKSLYEPCSYLLNMGGKRIRPVLALMAHEMFKPLNDDIWNVALAIELFHNFTLMHDDIMDQAPLRRGQQTVHIKYNIPTAILSGDVLSIYAYEHLNKVSNQYIKSIISIFNITAIGVCEGQQYDMDFEIKEEITVDDYLMMIEKKTSILLGCAVKLGAITGGATESCSQELYLFGVALGMAFQLQDDYLDSFGESQKTGKQVGGDILANKKTYLLAKAFELSDNAEKKELQTLLALKDKEKVEKVLQFYQNKNIKEHTLTEISSFTKLAVDYLNNASVLSAHKKHLYQIVTTLLVREY
ncbi:MAG: polyprenyl synthetase family protein [Chitinophagaceae bacterium]